MPVGDAWTAGGVARVGDDVAVIGPSGGIDAFERRSRRIAATLGIEIYSVAASSSVGYAQWAVLDANGEQVRHWMVSAAGDEVETESFGDPLPEEAGVTALDEGAVEHLLAARTGVRVADLAAVPSWHTIRLDADADAAMRAAERERRRAARAALRGEG